MASKQDTVDTVDLTTDPQQNSQTIQQPSTHTDTQSTTHNSQPNSQKQKTPKSKGNGKTKTPNINSFFKPAAQPTNATVEPVKMSGTLEEYDELMDNTHESDLLESMIEVESAAQSTPNGEKRKQMAHPASENNTPTKHKDKRPKPPSERIINAGVSARRRLSKGNTNQLNESIEDVDDPEPIGNGNISEILGNTRAQQTVKPMTPIHVQKFLTQDDLKEKAKILDQNIEIHKESIDKVLAQIINLQSAQEKTRIMNIEYAKKTKDEHEKGAAAINEISALLINSQQDIRANSDGVQQNELWIKENREAINDVYSKMADMDDRIDGISGEDIDNALKTLSTHERVINRIAEEAQQANEKQQVQNHNIDNSVKKVLNDVEMLKKDQVTLNFNTEQACNKLADNETTLKNEIRNLMEEREVIKTEIRQISSEMENLKNSENNINTNTNTANFSQDMHEIKKSRASEVQKTIFVMYNNNMNVNKNSNTHTIFDSIQRNTTLSIDTPAAISPRQNGFLLKYNTQSQANRNIAKIKSGSKNSIACFGSVLPEDSEVSKEMKNKIRNDYNTAETKWQVRHSYHYSKANITLFPAANHGVSLIYSLIDKKNNKKKIFTATLGIDDSPSLIDISEGFFEAYPREGETLDQSWIKYPQFQNSSNTEQNPVDSEANPASHDTPGPSTQHQENTNTQTEQRNEGGNQGNQNNQNGQTNNQRGKNQMNNKQKHNKNGGKKQGFMDRHVVRGNAIPRF